MNPSDMTTSQESLSPQTVMSQMATGYWVSQCIYVAAKLGIADLLKDGAQFCDALATATDSHSHSLYRLFRALASVGIFTETQPRCFALTPLANCLQSDVPGSMRSFILMLGEEHYQAWGDLISSVKTGESAFENRYGMEVFEYYAQHPASGQIFEEAMADISAIERTAVLAAYDFSGASVVVDIGGGYGDLLAAVLQDYPHLKGILFDLPQTIAQAEPTLEKAGVAQRCQRVEGNFFESVPTGGDLYLLKHIMHDWDDDRAIAILRCCHEAMAAEGRLLVLEQVIPPGNDPFPGKLLDLNMLVMTSGGRERTADEYRQLFEAAGFQLRQIIPTQSEISAIEGVPMPE